MILYRHMKKVLNSSISGSKIISLFFFLISLSLFGQVEFTKIPLDNQLVARNGVTGIVEFEGTVSNLTPYNDIKIVRYRDGINNGEFTYELNNPGGISNFASNSDITIVAETKNYSFEIYGLTDDPPFPNPSIPDVLIATISNVVAGDVYIIQGQSNAVANIRDGVGPQSNFIRVYASGTETFSKLQTQDVWSIANVNSGSEVLGNTGQWGAKIASLIIDKYDIPVAIFNGARGGKFINYFTKDYDGIYESTPATNNYFRLKYRLDRTGLGSAVKAIFWSQGENVSQTVSDYKLAFEDLRTSWLSDFSGVKQFYIFQISNGCNAYYNTNTLLLHVTKEAQRQLAEENNDIQIMNTDGLEQYLDGGSLGFCHFVYNNGYEGFGERIFPLVDSYFYTDTPVEPEYLSPNITDAYLIDDVTLVLNTDAEKLYIDNSTEAIKNFVLDGNGTIMDAYTSGNQIVFTLSEYPGVNAKISNIGALPGVNDNLITNATNDVVGPEILSFYEYSIRSDLITIWNNNAWSNGSPTDSKNTIIDDDYNGINADLITKDLKVNAGSTLNYNTNSNNSVIVNGNMVINGNFIVGDIESLIIDDVNADVEISGSYRKIEKSTELTNNFDVTYWSSSVENTNINDVFITKGVNSSRIFYYDLFKENPLYTGDYIDYRHWHNALGSDQMTPGQGFSVDGPEDATSGTQLEVEFTGKPNYKDISIPIGTAPSVLDDNDRTNLIGNPYPSAISADQFISANSSIKNGTLYLWSHGTEYGGDQYDPDDYLTYNSLGGNLSDIELPYFIASGQGFMILTDVSNGTINFENSMQVTNNNTEFYKSRKKKKGPSVNDVTKRLWLKLLKNNAARKEILIGYSDGGSESVDYGLDGKLINTEASLTFYSLIDNEKYAIQGLGRRVVGKPVKLGFSSLESGNFKLGIAKTQGFGQNKRIFLKDRNTGSIHDLSKSDYEFFISKAGDFPDRFSIRFVGGNENYGDYIKNVLKVTNNSNGFKFNGPHDVKEIKIYDIYGRVIYHSFPNNNSFNIRLNKVKKGTIVIIRSIMKNGHIHTHKMIKK
ncbi:sialate O-acetylesterase [Lutimonas halocynthiae]|uniref:sialate O-acetylesterase n=1 Tax=Lutimonas halocynthiae TaxID=1446477 RepID=UPI0025B4BD6F|nr:sialate O-acetylesterase [Lutimonas halocynthiae]